MSTTSVRPSGPGTRPAVAIQATSTSVLSYALAHNRVPVVSRLAFTNHGGAVQGATVRLGVRDAEGPIGTPVELLVDLDAGHTTVLNDVGLAMDPAAMLQIEEQRPGSIEIDLLVDGEDVGGTAVPVQVLAANQWVAEGHAFCGYWREERSAESVATTDVAPLVNLVDLGLIRLVETTLLTSRGSAGADLHAPAYSAWLAGAGDLDRVLGVTDVHRARRDGIVPLPARTRGRDGAVQVVEYRPAVHSVAARPVQRTPGVGGGPGQSRPPPTSPSCSSPSTGSGRTSTSTGPT